MSHPYYPRLSLIQFKSWTESFHKKKSGGKLGSPLQKTTIACMTNTWRSFSRFWAPHLHPRGSCAGLHPLELGLHPNGLSTGSFGHTLQTLQTQQSWQWKFKNCTFICFLWSILWSELFDFTLFFPFFPCKTSSYHCPLLASGGISPWMFGKTAADHRGNGGSSRRSGSRAVQKPQCRVENLDSQSLLGSLVNDGSLGVCQNSYWKWP
jgi:hypothetical protein